MEQRPSDTGMIGRSQAHSSGPPTDQSMAEKHNTQINVLIMNLPFRARWQDVKDLCRQACHIERADVALEVDGRSRGFGEVTCNSRADAQKLFQMLDGMEWQNRKLSVIVMDGNNEHPINHASSHHLSLQQPPYSLGNQGRTRELESQPLLMQSQVPVDDKLLFIGNLPFSMQWQDLKDMLRPAGRVIRTDISMSNDGRSRGWGTASFASSDDARRAVDMFNNTEVDGRLIKVRLDKLGSRGLPTNQQSNLRHGQLSMMNATQPMQYTGLAPPGNYGPAIGYQNYDFPRTYPQQNPGQIYQQRRPTYQMEYPLQTPISTRNQLALHPAYTSQHQQSVGPSYGDNYTTPESTRAPSSQQGVDPELQTRSGSSIQPHHIARQ